MIGTPHERTRLGAAVGPLASTFGLAVMLAGCHAAGPLVPPTPATPARVAAAPLAAPARDDNWVVGMPIASNMEQRIYDLDKDGSRRILHGAFRMIFRGDASEIAADVFASPLANAFQLGASWYFVTSQGDIFRTATFLGAPTSIGASVAPKSLFVETSGHTAFLADGFGELWSFDGEKSRRLDVPGLAGGVWHTADGTPIIERCGRKYTIGADGATAPTRLSFADDTGAGVGSVALEHIRERVGAAIASRSHSLDDALRTLADGGAMSAAAFPDGSAAIRRAGGRCEILAAGSQPIGICSPAGEHGPTPAEAGGSESSEGEPASRTVYRLGANGTAEKWADIKPREPPVASFGPSLFLGEEYGHTWLHEGKRTRLESLALAAPCANERVEPQTEILGLFGSRLLVLQTCMERPPVHSFDLIDLGVESGRAPLSSFLPKETTIVDAAMSADQSAVSVTLADASGRLSVARGVDPGKLTIHALPPNAKAAAFVTARRGIAVGINLGQMWGTVDGAETWFPLAPPVAGDPASVPITQRPTCTMMSCSSGSDGSPVVWADARMLRDTGFEQAQLVAPGRAPADRAYPGLRPAHPVQIGYPEDERPKKAGCPESPASSARAAKHRR